MNTALANARLGISPQERQALIRRAHAERAEFLRDVFAALFSWVKQHVHQPAAQVAPRATPCT
jgi:hypothetical protein